MTGVSITPFVVLFFVTAFLYAAVGFGGGSTYNALLVISGADYQVIPMIALVCNLIVVSGNLLQFHKQKLIPWKFGLPIILVSIPAAFFAGRMVISQSQFVLVLGLSLLLSGLLMMMRENEVQQPSAWLSTKKGIMVNLIIGFLLGGLAGLVGIGGGIFFAPLLHLQRSLPTKQIAAFSSVFIFFNSFAGLMGQASKHSQFIGLDILLEYAWLFIAVFIGGQIGNRLGVSVFSAIVVRRLTGALVIYVAVRLLYIFFIN